MRAYLDVVGVRPADCYSAQATVDGVHTLGGAHTNVGPKQPCADGKDRMRAHGCRQVVFVYRDRPSYHAGRARWAAYQDEQLQARLERGDRRPAGWSSPTSPAACSARCARAAEAVERLHWDHWFEGAVEDVAPYRYCWPPVR